MSNFYYCNDCKKPTDIRRRIRGNIFIGNRLVSFVCTTCNGTNWKAIIDTPSGEKETNEA